MSEKSRCPADVPSATAGTDRPPVVVLTLQASSPRSNSLSPDRSFS